MILSRKQCTIKPITALESLGGGNGHTGLGQIRLQLIKYGTTQSGRNIPGDAGDHSTDRISSLTYLIDPLQHFLRSLFIGTSDNVRIDVLLAECIVVNNTPDILHLGHVGQNLDAMQILQDLASNRTGGHSPNGLSRARTTTTRNGPHTVLGIVGGIGMGGTVRHAHIVLEIIARSMILVPHQHGDGRTGRHVVDGHAAQYLDAIGLVAGSGDTGLTRTASVQIDLDVLAGDLDAGGTPIECHSYTPSMGFSPCRNSKHSSKRVTASHCERER
mmetsp:Transcript_11646/g.16492  ORF Transcript_11646/g.16492 Transcript_11646/m.16492 type:complete len:273 (+) Transcript_11646:355-1173(+)